MYYVDFSECLCVCACVRARFSICMYVICTGCRGRLHRLSFKCSVFPLPASTMSVIGSYMTECMQNAPVPLLSLCVVLSRSCKYPLTGQNTSNLVHCRTLLKVGDSVEFTSRECANTQMATWPYLQIQHICFSRTKIQIQT